MLPLENITVGELIRRNCVKYRRRPAIWYNGETISYAELEGMIVDSAGRLLKMGIRHGDHVAFLTDPDPDAVAMMYAIQFIGAVAVMLNTSLSGDELRVLIDKTDVRCLILGHSYKGDGYFAKLLPSDSMPSCVKKTVTLHNTDTEYPWIESLAKPNCEEVFAAADIVSPEDTSMILFTSGSTAVPKGVCSSHFSRVNGGIQQASDIGANKNDKFCVTVPIYHCFSIQVNLIAALAVGGCVCIPQDRHIASIVKTIDDAGCTILSSVPTLYHAIIAKPDFSQSRLKTLRTGIIGGSLCAGERFKRIERAFGPQFTLMSSLGQTECTAGLTVCNQRDSLETRSATVGHFMNYVEGKIADHETGKTLPVGETGEICVRGYLTMQRYYGDEEVTAKTLDADGWVHTGDLGVLDDKGYITLRGRCRELIIRGGENISPVEIEHEIEQDKSVAECKVVGVPDDHFGEEICACIRPADGASPDAGEIKARVRAALAYYKVPRYVLFFDTLPKTSKGALSGPECRKLAIKELGLE